MCVQDRNSDVIISSLGSFSVNWIKKRRSSTTCAKVAMTFHSEKQLRRIFDGFDFDACGTGNTTHFFMFCAALTLPVII